MANAPVRRLLAVRLDDAVYLLGREVDLDIEKKKAAARAKALAKLTAEDREALGLVEEREDKGDD